MRDYSWNLFVLLAVGAYILILLSFFALLLFGIYKIVMLIIS
jgi:hypothetical protein